MPVVTQVPKSTITVRVVNNGGILQPTGGPVTVSTSGTVSSSGANRFDSLDDVIETAPQEGYVPIYDADTDKYVVGQIDIDGGTF